jgi:hypothetical protein
MPTSKLTDGMTHVIVDTAEALLSAVRSRALRRVVVAFRTRHYGAVEIERLDAALRAQIGQCDRTREGNRE